MYNKNSTTIKILPENLINKIAAGEVVERPASVIKELVENSIDARAKNIAVTIKGSGKQYIRVVDDGVGMGRDDALLAFERHATSKIKAEKDMLSINTLGFRGEALPSIASVSNVTLLTSRENLGTQIIISGGQIKNVKEIGFPQGTSLEIKNLFFNIPARAKFLKTDTTELSHISRIITQQSLAHPKVFFKLENNGNYLINSPGIKSELKYKIADLFGNDLIKDLLEIKSEIEGISLYGFVSKTSVTRANRENQYFFVNKRYIKDRIINHALYEAYSHKIPNNRYPLCFLYITVNPDAVDVNVHPAKTEVRFYNQNKIHDFIKSSISKALYCPPSSFLKNNITDTKEKAVPENRSFDFFLDNRKEKIKESVENFISANISASDKPDYTGHKVTPLATPSSLPSKKFNSIGQVNNTFIIAENQNGMLIVDQHTAHERILYESFLKDITSSKIKIQPLLIPLKIELNKGESIILQNNLDKISKLGIEIELFGPNTFILRTVPVLLVGQNYEKIVKDIVDTLSQYGKITSISRCIEKLAARMACKAAVKANQKLKREEIDHLLSKLDSAEIPVTCPHGRPIKVFLPIEDIEKKFMR